MHNPFDSWHQLQRFSIRKLSVGVVSATIGTAVVDVMLPGDTHHAISQVETGQSAPQYVLSPESSVPQNAGVTALPTEDSLVPDQVSLPERSEEPSLSTGEENRLINEVNLIVTEAVEAPLTSSDGVTIVSPEMDSATSDPLVEPVADLSDSVIDQGVDQQVEPSNDESIVSAVPDSQEDAKQEPETSLQPETVEETPVSETSLDMPASADQPPSESPQETPAPTVSEEEFIQVVEEAAASLTQAELYKPVGRRLLVSVGSSVAPKDLIDQSSELPADAQIDWVEQPGKLTAGSSKTVRILVRFSDGSQQEVTSILSVNAQQAQRYSPEGRQLAGAGKGIYPQSSSATRGCDL